MSFVIFLGCSSDDGVSNSQLIGEWKLEEAQFIGLEPRDSSEGTIDYSEEDIVYNFRFEGTLIVTGVANAEYSAGSYSHSFGEDHLGGAGDPKILLVNIDGSKWTYALTDGQMRLGKSYVDGPDLIFVRK